MNEVRSLAVEAWYRRLLAPLPYEEKALLTEAEVQRSFRILFKSKEILPDAFEKAEALLDELRAESPLRHRLSLELEEIRKLHTAKV
jgi:hypothetical protein